MINWGCHNIKLPSQCFYDTVQSYCVTLDWVMNSQSDFDWVAIWGSLGISNESEDNSNHYFVPDIDECQTNNGGCRQICNNLVGGYICECDDVNFLCAEGYERDPETDMCHG